MSDIKKINGYNIKDAQARSDLAAEVTARQEADSALSAELSANITAETEARQAQDTAISQQIQAEAATRQAQDTAIRQEIQAEADARQIQDTNIQAEIATLASGSPLVASSVEGMTDTSRVYVNTTDGKWYYHNGSGWTVGGTYQSTEYGENSIPSKSIKNVGFNKIDNNIIALTLTSEMFSNLNNVTKEEDNTTITIRRTDETINAQFRLKIPVDETSKDIKIIFNLSNIRCLLSFNMPNANNAAIAPAKWGNGQVELVIPKEYLQSTTQILVTLYANTYKNVDSGDIIATFSKSAYITNSDYFETTTDRKLSEILNNIQNFNNLIDKNKTEIKLTKIYGSANKIDELIVNNNDYRMTLNYKDTGMQTNTYFYTNGFVKIKGKVSNDSNSVNIYLFTYEQDNTSHIIFLGTFLANKNIDVNIDLSYYAVYQNLDHFYLVVNSGTVGTFKIENLEIEYTENSLKDSAIYDESLGNTLLNIDNEISAIKSDIQQLGSNTTLTAPNGNKYKIIVNNDGELSTLLLNTTPTKGLYIGNSLLLGFGSHGMASHDTTDDYFALVNNYLQTVNSNFTASKMSGTDWEAATTQSQVNSFLSSLESNLETDTDIVFIQLGDNCNTTEKINYIETKAPALIEAIQRLAPNAAIYWIASWYNNSTKQNLIVNACNSHGVKYINIAALNTTQNQAYIGYEYIDSNNQTQTISSSGVASHPSTTGMQAIADKIIQEIEI